MVTLMDYPPPLRLLSAAGELKMPLSDTVKYCILGISVTLLILALAILAWQTFRCCTQRQTTYTQQDTVNSDELYSDEKSTVAGNYSGAPSTKVADVSTEVRRLSRCLSRASFSSSGPSQTDGDLGEQGNIKRSLQKQREKQRGININTMSRQRLQEQVPLQHKFRKESRVGAWQVVSGSEFHRVGAATLKALLTKVTGSIRFSVYYDQLQSRLVVTVLQVEGLLEHSQTCSLQPFVKIRLMLAGSLGVEVGSSQDEEGERTSAVLWTVLQEWRTRVVKGSCNPLYGDQFSCILQQDKDELHYISLRMEVRDFDKFSRHSVLGEVRVPLRQLNISYPLELQEDLQIPQKDFVGEVLLSLKFLPTSQRLEVGLLKIRTALSEIFSDAALYARISIHCNQCRLRYQKTSVVARCLVTVFNEVLMFSLPEFPLEQCKITVSVYETRMNKKSAKHLMGQLTLGKDKSSEDEHWSLMMRSVRQPIAKWHGLLI